MEVLGSRTPLATLIAAVGIRVGEGRRVALLFAYLLAASSVFILGRTVRDTLFLSRYSLSALPWMFVAYGVASAITVVGYAQIADRMPRARLVVASIAIASATYLATFALVHADIPWIYPVFYVWSEVVANLLLVQFWTIANDLHDPRAARRLFPTIGAARVVGVVAIGLVSGTIVRWIGTAQLLLVLVGLMFAIAWLAATLAREPHPPTSKPRPKRGRQPRILGDRYVQVLATFILLAFAALTIGDYQFKAIARASFREDELARFFSLFYATVGAIGLLFQVVVTPRLLRRFGVGWGLGVMPGVFGVASACLLGVPHLVVASVMKFADNGLQYTVHETSLQALYAPFPEAVKARTRAFLDAVIKPLSYGAGGLVLVVLASRVDVRWLSLVTIVLVVPWIGLIPMIRRRYVRTLEAALATSGVVDAPSPFESARATKALLAVLADGPPQTILAALDQLEGERSVEFVRRLEQLASNADATVRAVALERLADLPGAEGRVALAALSDPSARVRAAATRACAGLLGDGALEHLVPLQADVEQDVRVSATAGLFEHCGVEGAIEGGRVLANLVASERVADRVEAARILRRLGRAAYRPVRALLGDADPEVRRAALRAAEFVADPRLIPPLLAALSGGVTRQRAAAALVAIGEPAVWPLAELLGDASVARAVRLAVPRILRDIPSRHAYAMLRAHVEAPDGHLRLRVLGAMSTLRSRLSELRERNGVIEQWVRFELRAGYRNMAGWRRARASYDTPLLREEFEFRQLRALRRILRILELRYERAPLRLVRTAIDRGQRRATAIEVLDTLLEPNLRAMLLAFFDDGNEAELLARAGPLMPEIPTPEDFLVEQCQHPNPFVVACALAALSRRPGEVAKQQAEQALAHPDPLVREQAQRSLLATDRARAIGFVGAVAPDPDPVVADTIAAVARLTSAAEELTMHSTLEKVLILKGTPLFSRVAAEDLAPLARLAEQRRYEGGERIVSEGEYGDQLFLIVSGKVEITRAGRPVASMGPGEAFGEISVLDAGPRTATATAIDATEVLAIGSEEFYEILYEQTEIAEGVIRMLVKRLRDSNAGT